MRNLSLEQFYKRISNKIAVVGGYLDDKSICSVIKSCRLKPLSVYSKHFTYETKLEDIWVDEFGHLLSINKKKTKIKPLSATIPDISTDIFKYEKVEFIVDHSSYACIGISPDTTNFILLLMGTDNYFRCYECKNDVIRPLTPLIVGLKILKYCMTMKPVKYFKKLTIKSELQWAKNVEWFIVPLPANKLLIPNIVAYKQLRNILYNE